MGRASPTRRVRAGPTTSRWFPRPAVSGSWWPAAPEQTLTVDGSGFVRRSVVRWNGADRPTTYISGARLSAALTAADLAAPGSAEVTVFTRPSGRGLSAPATALIAAPPGPPPRILIDAAHLGGLRWSAAGCAERCGDGRARARRPGRGGSAAGCPRPPAAGHRAAGGALRATPRARAHPGPRQLHAAGARGGRAARWRAGRRRAVAHGSARPRRGSHRPCSSAPCSTARPPGLCATRRASSPTSASRRFPRRGGASRRPGSVPAAGL